MKGEGRGFRFERFPLKSLAFFCFCLKIVCIKLATDCLPEGDGFLLRPAPFSLQTQVDTSDYSRPQPDGKGAQPTQTVPS